MNNKEKLQDLVAMCCANTNMPYEYWWFDMDIGRVVSLDEIVAWYMSDEWWSYSFEDYLRDYSDSLVSLDEAERLLKWELSNATNALEKWLINDSASSTPDIWGSQYEKYDKIFRSIRKQIEAIREKKGE